MRKPVLSAIVLGAALTMAIGGVSAQAGVKTVSPTKLTSTLAKKKTQALDSKKISLPKETNGRKGAALVKFTVKKDGYLTAAVMPDEYTEIYAYACMQADQGVTVGSSVSFSLGSGSGTSSQGTPIRYTAPATFTVYTDRACKSKVSRLSKVDAGSSFAGAYVKKGTYYMLVASQVKEAQKMRVAVGYVPHKDQVSLSANKYAIGANKKKGSSLYKITVPKKQKITIQAYGEAGKVQLLSAKKKVLSTGSLRSGFICSLGVAKSGSMSSSIGTTATPAKFLSKTLAKGTYYIMITGEGPHFLRYYLN